MALNTNLNPGRKEKKKTGSTRHIHRAQCEFVSSMPFGHPLLLALFKVNIGKDVTSWDHVLA